MIDKLNCRFLVVLAGTASTVAIVSSVLFFVLRYTSNETGLPASFWDHYGGPRPELIDTIVVSCSWCVLSLVFGDSLGCRGCSSFVFGATIVTFACIGYATVYAGGDAVWWTLSGAFTGALFGIANWIVVLKAGRMLGVSTTATKQVSMRQILLSLSIVAVLISHLCSFWSRSFYP